MVYDFNLYYPSLTDKDHVFKKIDYDQLMDLINCFFTGVVYIGGPWCKGCQAVISLVNDECKKKGITEVYSFDPTYTNYLGEATDLRDCLSLEDKLKYYDLVEKIKFNNSTNEYVKDTLISRMHVPFFFVLKNGTCEDFFSMELAYNNGSYVEEESLKDKKEEFIKRFDLLISNIL